MGTRSLLLGSRRNTAPLSQIAGVQANFDLDATVNYSSGTNWANMIASPDDGTAQSGYDFTSTGSPTFTGTPGDPGAYFSLGGAAYWQIASGANTTFLNGLHKSTSGKPFTAIIAFKSSASPGSVKLWGTAAAAADHGCRGSTNVTPDFFFVQDAGGTQKTFDLAAIAGSTIYLTAMAVDVTGGTLKYANNARSFTTVASPVYGTDTTNASFPFQIAAVNGATPLASGSLVYGFYMFNKVLSDADLSKVVDVLNSRHARLYA